MCGQKHSKLDHNAPRNHRTKSRAHVCCNIVMDDGFHSRTLNESYHIVRCSLITFEVCSNVTHRQVRMTSYKSTNSHICPPPSICRGLLPPTWA
eukprot:scaffold13557_cov141-Alexandrium_tamarense.AAC.1